MGRGVISRVCILCYQNPDLVDRRSSTSALKTGGSEVVRESWDELDDDADADQSMDFPRGTDTMDISELTGPTSTSSPLRKGNLLPDWTRSPLRPGAPDVPRAVRPIAPLPRLVGEDLGGPGTTAPGKESIPV